jgi:hypothetical protein
VSSGAPELPVNYLLDTTRLTDGFHELTVVGYEGTSVRTQTRTSRSVRIQNTGLAASFSAPLTGTNVTLDTPLRFTVSVNASNVSTIELFSTGGLIGAVTNQSVAVLAAPTELLGLGLHPFHALVTDNSGNRYRTETIRLRIVPSFSLTISQAPLELSWPAISGQKYDVLYSTNSSSGFVITDSVTATNSAVHWPLPAPTIPTFYRVRFAPSGMTSVLSDQPTARSVLDHGSPWPRFRSVWQLRLPGGRASLCAFSL